MKAEVSTVGIIGGGQLGMFLAQACQKIGLITHIYSDTDDAPAKKYANKLSKDRKVVFIQSALGKKDNIEKNMKLQHKRAFSSFLEISPKNYPLTITKSKLLLEMKRFFESEELIRDQLIRRNEDPELWLLLSEIQRNSKNIVGYHQSRAEYFLLLGQNEQALGQLEFALNLTKNNFQVSERIMNQIISIKKAIGESRGF